MHGNEGAESGVQLRIVKTIRVWRGISCMTILVISQPHLRLLIVHTLNGRRIFLFHPRNQQGRVPSCLGAELSCSPAAASLELILHMTGYFIITTVFPRNTRKKQAMKARNTRGVFNFCYLLLPPTFLTTQLLMVISECYVSAK